MNILIFDLEICKNDIFDIVANYLKNTTIYKTQNEKEFLKKLESSQYDLLIIDVTTILGEEVFEKATKRDKETNILVVSSELTYNGVLSCEDCCTMYNRKLLLKPLKVKELVNYIQNYKSLTCKYSLSLFNINEILEEVLQQFTHYKYEKDKAKIKLLDKNIEGKELINITDLLDTNNIKYTIDNDDIKLLF